MVCRVDGMAHNPSCTTVTQQFTALPNANSNTIVCVAPPWMRN